MRLKALVFIVSVVAASIALQAGVAPHHDRDVSKLLAAARLALGGDAALSAVSSFTASGSVAEARGPSKHWLTIKIACALPDKFVLETVDDGNSGPVSGQQSAITQRDGFNGDIPIESTDPAPDIRLPFPRLDLRVQSQIPEANPQLVSPSSKITFAQLMLPLFASSLSAMPLTFTDGGQTPNGLQDIVVVHGPQDHEIFNLFLDAKGHLPFAIGLPGRPMAVRQTLITDYKKSNGLNWPHRFITTADGAAQLDETIGGYKINPKIDPKTFSSTK